MQILIKSHGKTDLHFGLKTCLFWTENMDTGHWSDSGFGRFLKIKNSDTVGVEKQVF